MLRKRTKEHCLKISQAHKGKHYSPKTEFKRGPAHFLWKGGRRITSKGYVHLYMPEHPSANYSGHIYEHRLVMERKIGRSLKKDEFIHHINGNKQDNRIENLKMVDARTHWRIHMALGTAGGRRGKNGKRDTSRYALPFS